MQMSIWEMSFFSISAGRRTADKFDETTKPRTRGVKRWSDDIKQMNEALVKEGFNYGIIEAYSCVRVKQEPG